MTFLGNPEMNLYPVQEGEAVPAAFVLAGLEAKELVVRKGNL
jgi:hypothetical protein